MKRTYRFSLIFILSLILIISLLTFFILPSVAYAETPYYTEKKAPVKQIGPSELESQSNKESDSKEKIVYKIEVVPYDSNWSKIFENEAAALKQHMGNNAVEIHHVGSTSVPGLNAKPIIDILGVVKNAKNSIKTLESLGYEYKGEYNIPFHFSFSKKTPTKIHLHVFEEGNPEIELNLLFRDYLRTHPETRKEYTELKSYLLTQKTSFEKNNSKFKGYNLGKDAFIRKVLQNAGFDKLRITHCTHTEEWKMAKFFRQKYVFDKIKTSDPYIFNFNDSENVHFALNQGMNIVGYANLQLLPKDKAVVRIFVIDEAFQARNFEEQFLTMIEKWIKSKNYKYLHVISSLERRDFYQKHGYKKTSDLNNELKDYKIDPKDQEMKKIF